MKRPRSSQAISPTGMRFPPSNLLPLIISVASPTPSHPLLFLYWHCHRHRTCPSPHPSIHLITSLYSSKDAPFPPISLSLSLYILPIVSPPIPLRPSQWPPSREIHHSNLAETANTAKRASTRICSAHAHKYIQTNREKQDPDKHFTMAKNWRATICYCARI